MSSVGQSGTGPVSGLWGGRAATGPRGLRSSPWASAAELVQLLQRHGKSVPLTPLKVHPREVQEQHLNENEGLSQSLRPPGKC